MIPLQAGDLADHFVAIRIHNQDLGSVRQVCTAGGSIDRNVIEIFTATFCGSERNFLEQVVTTCEWTGEKKNAHAENAQYNGDEILGHKILRSSLWWKWEKLSANSRKILENKSTSRCGGSIRNRLNVGSARSDQFEFWGFFKRG